MAKNADIIRFLNAKGVSPLCPSCGANNWAISTGTTEFPHGLVIAGSTDGTFSLPPPGYPVAVMLCNNCAFVRLHSTALIDKWVAERGKAEPKFEDWVPPQPGGSS